MKKFLSLIILLLCACVLVACSEEARREKAVLEIIGAEEKELVDEAVELIADTWDDRFESLSAEREFPEYLEIKNVRLVHIEEAPEKFYSGCGKIEYIVEFVLFANHFGSDSGYYPLTNLDSEVVFYKDGTAEVANGTLTKYIGMTYDVYLEDFDIEVYDLGSLYNEVLTDE